MVVMHGAALLVVLDGPTHVAVLVVVHGGTRHAHAHVPVVLRVLLLRFEGVCGVHEGEEDGHGLRYGDEGEVELGRFPRIHRHVQHPVRRVRLLHGLVRFRDNVGERKHQHFVEVLDEDQRGVTGHDAGELAQHHARPGLTGVKILDAESQKLDKGTHGHCDAGHDDGVGPEPAVASRRGRKGLDKHGDRPPGLEQRKVDRDTKHPVAPAKHEFDCAFFEHGEELTNACGGDDGGFFDQGLGYLPPRLEDRLQNREQDEANKDDGNHNPVCGQSNAEKGP
mmetsp:Transcript_18992/g.45491  ORF Transcript_18992/g.45491 Transcript_18992/m.45491 type:complete len:280 (-) Transcript_18992:215-1054(-)